MQEYRFHRFELRQIEPDVWNDFTDLLCLLFQNFKEESRMAARPDVISLEWLSDLFDGKSDPIDRPESFHWMTNGNEDADAFAMTTPQKGGTHLLFIYSSIRINGKHLLEHIEELTKAEGKTHVSLCSLICALPPYLSLGYSPRKPSGQRGWNATLTVTSWPLRVAESTAAKQKTRRRMTMRASVDTEDNCIILVKDRKGLGRVPTKRLRYRVGLKMR
jgi:hypothetical protein